MFLSHSDLLQIHFYGSANSPHCPEWFVKLVKKTSGIPLIFQLRRTKLSHQCRLIGSFEDKLPKQE